MKVMRQPRLPAAFAVILVPGLSAIGGFVRLAQLGAPLSAVA